jgi:hypothetical protein
MSAFVSFRPARFAGMFVLTLLSGLVVPARAETKPFEPNMERVKIVDAKGLAAPTYFVPGVNLIVTCAGDVWAQSKKGGGNAQAHGRFYVKGFEKALLQDLARQAQDDLVAKLRATGATVLTYDDLKDHPVVAGHGRRSPDPKWGLPTSSLFSNLTFLTAAPTDAQLYDRGMAAGAAFWLHPLAKEKKLVVILPEITLTVPQMWGEVDAGYKRDSAGVAVNTVMLLHAAAINVSNPQNSFTNISIQTHGKRPACEATGTMKLMSQDSTEFSKSWQRSSSDWVMTLDPQAFSGGVLRVTSAINTMIAEQVKKVRK